MAKCRHCKAIKKPADMIKVPLGHFCDMDCATAHARQKVERQRDKQAKAAQRQSKAAAKELRLTDRSHQLKLTQAVFNRWIREVRDADQPCISCGRHHQGQYHAGHYRTVGSSPELRFEPLNCWKQCSACNAHLSGNITNYRINLVKKIGADKVEWLEGKHEPKKYTCEQLVELRAHYSKAIRDAN